MSKEAQIERVSRAAVKSFKDYFLPTGITLSQDALMEQGGNVSLLRLVDTFQCPLPTPLPLWVSAEFAYNNRMSPADYAGLNPSFELRLVNPHGKSFTIGQLAAHPPDTTGSLSVMRVLMNVSGAVTYQNEGLYTFELYGRLDEADYELLLQRGFTVKRLMRSPGQLIQSVNPLNVPGQTLPTQGQPAEGATAHGARIPTGILDADTLVRCLEIISPEVLAAFESFLAKNGDRRWLILSDYHFTKEKPYVNDVAVFTILPGAENFVTLEEVKRGLPCKLSQSKVKDDALAFLQDLNHFTFAFVLDRKFRPFGSSPTVIRGAVRHTLSIMESWENAADCTAEIDKVRALLSDPNPNMKAMNYAIFVGNIAASIATLIAQRLQVDLIGWGSDRDAIVDNWGRIADTVFEISTSSFLQQRGLPQSKIALFIEPPSGDKNAPKPPLWYQHYINIPDYFAAPVAEIDLKKPGYFRSGREKYARIIYNAVADNPNVAILHPREVAEGWGFHHVVVKQKDFSRDSGAIKVPG